MVIEAANGSPAEELADGIDAQVLEVHAYAAGQDCVAVADRAAGRWGNRLAALLLCICIGVFGAHRFYVGKTGTGILYLFTFGLFTIGAIYDLVLIGTGEFRDSDGRKVVYWQY